LGKQEGKLRQIWDKNGNREGLEISGMRRSEGGLKRIAKMDNVS
jgi:hypothetical protein